MRQGLLPPFISFPCVCQKWSLLAQRHGFFGCELDQNPFMIDLGIINTTWFPFGLAMMIPAVLATLVAPHILKRIPQNTFSILIWFFIVLAAVKLLVG